MRTKRRTQDQLKNTSSKGGARFCPQVLTIAGSDPGGGAGIQGDIKTIEANGAYALSVLTSVTAQNTVKMTAAFDIPLRIIEAQLNAIFDDFDPLAIKTGVLSSKAIVVRIAHLLKKISIKHLVVDPVMISKSGYPLLNPEAVSVLISDLIPMASLLTPNIEEAERLTDLTIRTVSQAESAAKKIRKLGCHAVLIKGGHLSEAPGCDILFDGSRVKHFNEKFFDTPHTHGTGCGYSAAIATHLAKGKPLDQAVLDAKRYVTAAISHPLAIGHGQGPINHFYFLPSFSK